MTGNVVEFLYEVVAPKTGRSSTLNGLTTPLHCTSPTSNRPTLWFNIACVQHQLKRCQFNWGRKSLQQGNNMKQYGIQRRVPEPSPMPHLVCYLCYCYYSYKNSKVILTNFTPSQNSWGPTASNLALWWLNFGPTGICRATKFVPAKWGMFGDLKALCRLHLHNMKKQPVVFFRKKLGVANLFYT